MKHTQRIKPGVVAEIPVGDLEPDPNQPRKAFLAKPLADLAMNIKARGIKQPITITDVDGRKYIKTGERRWRAAKLAGLKTVPCLLDIERDAGDVLVDQLAENDLREDLNPMERAEALDKLRQFGMGPAEISEHLAKHGIILSRPAISNLLRLNALPDAAKEVVRKGALAESYARELLPFVDPEITPKIVADTCKALAKAQNVTKRDFYRALNSALKRHATQLYPWQDTESCSKKCSCFVSVPSEYSGTVTYCLDKNALAKKRTEAEERKKKKAEKTAAKKKPDQPAETDPTKAKPVKVKINDNGIVATNRLHWRKYNELRKDYPEFDQAPCDGCPHNHLASDDGKKPADPTCFYPPCFDNLKRQGGRIRNRNIKIREMLDEQMLPELLKVAAAQPVAGELLKPLLTFHAGSGAGSHYGAGDGLSSLPGQLKRRRLIEYLERPQTDEDACTVVRQMLRALPREWRHELALYLSMLPNDWWRNTEAFAKLFTKAELKAMLPGFDPPDVPVGEWRARLINDVKTPAIIGVVWREDWVSRYDRLVNDQLADDFDDLDEEQAAA